MVSYIYYPTGTANVGHAELEVEGECRGLSGNLQYDESLKRKIKRSTTIDHFRPPEMQGRYFKQYYLTVTPQELKQLKESIKKEDLELDQLSNSAWLLFMAQSLTYKTCSYQAISKLSENCNFNIPMPYKSSPLLTDLYIKVTKPAKIKQIKKYGQRRGYEGELGECRFIAIALSLPMFFFIYSLYIIKIHR